jgi:hypothetical protein
MLGRFLLGVHALALAAAWLNPLPTLARLGLSLAIAWSLWRHWHPDPKTQITGLRILPDGAWRLSLPADGQAEARLLGGSIANPVFVLLRLDTGQAVRTVLVCRDSLESDGYRCLRVALRVFTLDGEGAGRFSGPP